MATGDPTCGRCGAYLANVAPNHAETCGRYDSRFYALPPAPSVAKRSEGEDKIGAIRARHGGLSRILAKGNVAFSMLLALEEAHADRATLLDEVASLQQAVEAERAECSALLLHMRDAETGNSPQASGRRTALERAARAIRSRSKGEGNGR